MVPKNNNPLSPRDAELLERYVVAGVPALGDPEVAAVVAAHPDLIAEIDAGLTQLRFDLALDAGPVRIPQRAAVRGGVFSRRVLAANAPRTLRTPSILLRAHTGSVCRALLGAVAAAASVAAIVLVHAPLHSPRTDAPHVVGKRYATMVGQHALITLIDGTRVTLGPQTVLHLGTSFGADSRDVSLSGEAYFDVPHASRVPFVVHTGNVSTRVLGTAFGVRAYNGDAAVRVSVVTGKVAVTAATPRHPSVLLTADRIADVTDSTATIAGASAVTQYTEWNTGRLVFREAPVSDVLTTMTRWYGYQFKLTDSTVASRHVTLAMDYGASADALLALKLVLNVTMEFDDHTVTVGQRGVEGRGSPSATSRDRREISSPSTEVGR